MTACIVRRGMMRGSEHSVALQLLSHKYRKFTGSLSRMKHERFYRGVLQHSACSFYLLTFLGSFRPLIAALTLGTITQSTISSFHLKNFTGITFIVKLHVKPLLGATFPGGQACYILSVVLVLALAHVLLIPVNPLHTMPSGRLSLCKISAE